MEAKVSPQTAMKKAELLSGGPVRIPSEFRFPFLPSKSTAGPGAGSTGVVFAFGNTRAKKTISRDSGDFDLEHARGRLVIKKGGKVFIEDVTLIPTILHAPYQAFVNIDNACMFGCKFCASPRLHGEATKNLTNERILAMVKEASQKDGFRSVAFTSAVSGSPSMTVKRMAGLVSMVRKTMPEVPIGVEPYVTRPDEVDLLKAAGADEIKLNIESFDPDIFEKVCPDRDYGAILHSINHAGEVFGKNMVCSNIIFGLGETDESVLEGTKVLANMGAVATLRALRRNEYNLLELEKALGKLKPVTPERMLKLAKEQKKILKAHGLTPLRFRTMCHTCLSCDIVPFWDV